MNLELDKMSDKDKIKLISKIWNSIKKPELLPVPPEHKKELDTRLTDKNRIKGKDWNTFNQVLDQLIQ